MHEVCFVNILGRINEKELVTKASLWMFYQFVFDLVNEGVAKGIPNCFKLLSILEKNLKDFGFYLSTQVATQSKWAIGNCTIWLDILAGSKPKFYNAKKEEAFMLLKDGKVPSSKVEDIVHNLLIEEKMDILKLSIK